MSAPQIFTDLKGMRNQECDRPKALAAELARVGAVVASSDYDTLYVWPLGTPAKLVAHWHGEHNAGCQMIFHVAETAIPAEMPQ